MKTATKIFTGIAVVAVVLSTSAAVFADSGDGFMPGQIRGQGRGANSEQAGLLKAYMVSATAEVFGLEIEEVEARLAANETFITIALSQGYAIEDVDRLMGEAHSIAIDLAAADGIYLGSQAAYRNANQPGRRGQNAGIDGQAGAGFSARNCDGTGVNAEAAGRPMLRRGNW